MTAEWPRGKVQKLSVSRTITMDCPLALAMDIHILWMSNPLPCLQTITFFWDLLSPLGGDGTGMRDYMLKESKDT